MVGLAVPFALVILVALASGHDGDGSRAQVARPAHEGALTARAERSSKPRTASDTRASANLRPGSDPRVLPGPVLIADRDNNRLLEVSPNGRVLWRFPKPANLAPAQTFKLPDDAFFSSHGRDVIVTQEDDFAISVIALKSGHIIYRYGHPGAPGSEPGYVHNPDDALLMPSGEILSADIKNCRVLVIRPPAHRPLRQLGRTGDCEHRLGFSYGSPNGAFPMTAGKTAITEINGDWLDVLGSDGRPVLDTHPPGFTYPSDTNEVRPGLFLSVDYTDPGAIETFTSNGVLRWRYEPTGAGALDQPSLALRYPTGTSSPTMTRTIV
jgi:DNA-binding beta-propeller fold protein YncE